MLDPRRLSPIATAESATESPVLAGVSHVPGAPYKDFIDK